MDHRTALIAAAGAIGLAATSGLTLRDGALKAVAAPPTPQRRVVIVPSKFYCDRSKIRPHMGRKQLAKAAARAVQNNGIPL